MWVDFAAGQRAFRVRAFLFDKDGTLLSFDHWLAVMRARAARLGVRLALGEAEMADLLGFMGVEDGGGGVGGIIPLPRSDAEEAVAGYLAEVCSLDPARARAEVTAAFAEVDREFPFWQHVKPTPGATALLTALRRAGGRVAVVTHDSAAAASRHLSVVGWSGMVDHVIGVDVCPLRKPRPTPVLAACIALGVPPAEAVMVGDTCADLIAGRRAGCGLTVGVLTGLGDRSELAQGDLLLSDLTEIHVLG
ncbi:MAG: HAD family hydrolase [Candidatus Bipolaricaulaceae bacterium]